MKPYEISQNCTRLNEHYPNPDLFKDVLKKMKEKEMEWFIRLWLSEGIPKAFINNPMLYELIRDDLAKNIGIHPKEITIVGSARIGYSLSPNKYEYGSAFDYESDFDFSIVSSVLYDKLVKEFNTWKSEYKNGDITPKSSVQESYWEKNLNKHIPHQIKWNFIDSNLICEYYPITISINRALENFRKRLKNTDFEGQANRTKKIRIYKNWKAFIDHRLFSIKKLKEELKNS